MTSEPAVSKATGQLDGLAGLPLVSVAVLSFNQQDFLIECIESILAQDYSSMEIVIADDGSSDRSQEIAADFARRYPGRFVLRLSPENKGITANANAAHFACTGTYIAWMGGDDLMLPGKLRRQVDVMEADREISLCYHDLDVFLSETGERLYLFSQRSRPREGGVRAAIRYGTFNGGCATMVRRSATPRHGHDPRIERASDWLYWVETARRGRIAYINEVLGRYRRHSRNITSEASEFVRSLIEDHLLTCAILLKTMPRYAPEIFCTFARNLVSLARRTPGPGRWPMLAGSLMLFGAFLLTMPFAAISRMRRHRARSRATQSTVTDG